MYTNRFIEGTPGYFSPAHLLQLGFSDPSLPCCTCFDFQIQKIKNKEQTPLPERKKERRRFALTRFGKYCAKTDWWELFFFVAN
jgi:hypothetical protein